MVLCEFWYRDCHSRNGPRPQRPRTYTLTLNDVLHVPTAPCNGISLNPTFNSERGFAVVYHELTEVLDTATREPVFYANRFCGLYRAVLAGEQQGVSYMRQGGGYSLSIYVFGENMATLRRLAEGQGS